MILCSIGVQIMLAKYVTFPTKRAYGVELELSSYNITKERVAKIIEKTDRNREVFVSGWSYSEENDYWHVKDDSSCGWEIASYKSVGIKDLANIVKVTDAVAEAGAIVTPKCGFHLHVEVSDFTNDQIATLVAIWMKIEKVVTSSIPHHRVNNKYCRLLNDFYPKQSNKDLCGEGSVLKFWKAIKPNLKGNYNLFRRVALNIWNYVENSGKQTVEFRFPEGTLNSNDVKNWIRLLVHFVDYSKTQRFPDNTNEVGLQEALSLMGLVGTSNFYILSQGLRDTKDWFLHRLLRYSRIKKQCMDAVDELNNMWSPVKVYNLSPDCEVYFETI